MSGQEDEYAVERTESHVQCECPLALCRHQPDGYRVVVEWGVWDPGGTFLGPFDTRREAEAAVAADEARRARRGAGA